MPGFADDRFSSVAAVFEAGLAGGAEVGASLCITVDGETVVDLWGGFADAARTRPWQAETIVNVYSCTKTMTALTALLLAERGELDLAAPVKRYWPEFAANGKDQVTVAHLLSHSAGLSGWAEPITVDDLYDWDSATALLAGQAPFWTPGTASGYHVLTQGYLVGEVVRRVAGRTVGRVFRSEIAEPLGADFHIGLPASEDARVAEMIPPATAATPFDEPTEVQLNAATNPVLDVAAVTASRAWRGAEIPAANGTGNARSIARVHSALACGGAIDGVRLLSEAMLDRIVEEQIRGTDVFSDSPARFGMGFGLATELTPFPNPRTFFWGGWGGSIVVIDRDLRMSFAYAMNRMAPELIGDVRGAGVVLGAYTALAGL